MCFSSSASAQSIPKADSSALISSRTAAPSVSEFLLLGPRRRATAFVIEAAPSGDCGIFIAPYTGKRFAVPRGQRQMEGCCACEWNSRNLDPSLGKAPVCSRVFQKACSVVVFSFQAGNQIQHCYRQPRASGHSLQKTKRNRWIGAKAEPIAPTPDRLRMPQCAGQPII